MEPNQTAAFKYIEQAHQAMKAGDHLTARQLAAQAAQSAPELEEVWLLMAALASPRGSVAFLQKALAINPQSERAQKGMRWAQNRLEQELEKQAVVARQAAAEAPTTPPVVVEPIAAAPSAEQPVEAVSIENQAELVAAVPAETEQSNATTEPVVVTPEPEEPVVIPTPAVSEPKTSPRKPLVAPKPLILARTQGVGAVASRNYSSLTLPMLVIGGLALLFVLMLVLFNTTSAAALLNSGGFTGRGEHGPAWAEVDLTKSTSPEPARAAPVVVMPTATPLATAAPALPIPPTATQPPLQTATFLPTDTLVPTLIPPTLTATPLPTATLLPPTSLPTATAEVAVVAEGPSPTPLPTDTAEPVPTRYVAPTAKANSGGSTTVGSSGERWIDVDLTQQRVYAYEGNTLANSFVVSTGTWQYPTVTGQYHVYIKYRSTTMSGPGYSLPNVPYTMYFYKSYGIHGTYWHNNFGTPMSHGCVNLTIPDAEWLYNWSSVGTLVNIHY